MASVESRTRLSIDELIEGTIVSGYINASNQLILVNRAGAEQVAGELGPGGGGGSVDPETLARFCGRTADSPTEGDTGTNTDFTWDVNEQNLAGVISFGTSPHASRIYFNKPGLYSLIGSVFLSSGVEVARPTSSYYLRMYPTWDQSSDYTAFLHGGDISNQEPTVSYLYVLTQANIDAGHNYVDFTTGWTDWDDAMSGTYIDVHVQELGGGAGPKGDTGDAGAPGADGTDGVDGVDGAPGALPTRVTSTLTTNSISGNSYTLTTLPLATAFRLLSMYVTTSCRVRLFATAAGAAADVGRAINVDPPDGRGVLFDYFAPFGGPFLLSPLVDGASMETIPDTDISAIIDNPSGSPQSIGVSFIYLPQE